MFFTMPKRRFLSGIIDLSHVPGGGSKKVRSQASPPNINNLLTGIPQGTRPVLDGIEKHPFEDVSPVKKIVFFPLSYID